ncbi:MAG TPA: major facilitator superfamily domain-containing protein 6 [Rhodocyclaceae bacterium]|jgi:PPP family 3-phenylpropionic acid transporter|nr:major facilitator superfamily domain-containing protein 6 [Rhodocyclaceae bacterium]
MEQDQEPPRLWVYGRLSSFYFCYFAFVGAYNSYFGLYLKSLGFAALQIGVVISMMQVMRIFAPYLWGALADRRGRRTPLIRMSVGMGLLLFVPLFWLHAFAPMLVLIAVLALFWSAALPLTESLTLEHLRATPERYSRVRLWGSLGFIVVVATVGNLLDHAPAEAVLWSCIVLLAATVVAALRLPETRMQHHAMECAPLMPLLRRPEVVCLLAACFFMSVAHGPLYVFYSIHLVDHGYSKTAVGLLWGLGVVAEIVAFLFVPRILRRWMPYRLFTFCFAAAVLRFLLIAWCVDSLPLVLLAQILHGATFGICHATAMAALNRWFDVRHQGRVQGIYGSVSFGAGGLVGALVGSVLWQPFGAGCVYTLAALAAVFGLVLIRSGLPRGALAAA